MNPVYYIFLVIIVLSFITGLIITFIDNKRGVPIENEVVVKKRVPAKEKVAPVRSSNLNDTLRDIPALGLDPVDSVVPYLPVDSSTTLKMPVIYEEELEDATKSIPTLEMEKVSTNGFDSIPTTPISSIVQPESSNHQIQINNVDDSKQEYFSVPVLIPLPMDDDTL